MKRAYDHNNKRFALAALMLWGLGVAEPGRTSEAPPATHAPPRRIVIRGQSLFEDYLGERLPAAAHTQVDEYWGRTLALLEELGLKNVDFAVTNPTVYTQYNARSPVDALIFVRQHPKTPTEFTVVIHRAEGMWQKHYPCQEHAAGSLLAATREALGDVADQCGFTPEEKAALQDLGFKTEETMRAYFVAQYVLNARSNDNLGEIRLRRLMSVLAEDPTNPRLAAAILTDAELLYAYSGKSQAYAGNALTLAQNHLPLVLGTPHESAAHGIVRRFPDRFDQILRDQCVGLVNAQEVDLDASAAAGAEPGSELTALDAPEDVTAPTTVTVTPARACGALRLLGIARSKKGLPLLLAAAQHADALLREAAADGLAGYDDTSARDRLRALADDKDERVACAAALGLWARGRTGDGQETRGGVQDSGDRIQDAGDRSQETGGGIQGSGGRIQKTEIGSQEPETGSWPSGSSPVPVVNKGEVHPRLLALARARVGAQDPRKAQALAVLEALGEAQDAPALQRLCRDPEPALRLAAARGLIRLKALDDATLASLLADLREPVLAHALSTLPAQPGAAAQIQLRRLANDPDARLAELARVALMPLRPQDEWTGIEFDLELEHTFIRLRQIERLSGIQEAWATELLETSCTNRDAYVRAAALTELIRREPARGHARIGRALTDASPWVRYATAEALAQTATSADAAVVSQALEVETDLATCVCLREALAKAEGKPVPPPPPAARSLLGTQIRTWGGGMGYDRTNSPFTASLQRDFRPGGDQPLLEAHAAGKTIIGRIYPVYNPGSLMVDRKKRDDCWLDIDKTLNATNLVYIDGVVFGDGTMSLDPGELWPGGWRLFCLDAGLDPARVRGVQANLTILEQRAWAHWAGARCVEGFNALYDYLKGKVARLRPGIQVCTFLPLVGAKFDLIGTRNLTADNRTVTYNLVRQFKTLWPDCPVVCNGYGILHVESNLIQRGWAGPTNPMVTRSDRAYADAVTAYLAGADVNWWSYWVLHEPTWKDGSPAKGIGIGTEDLIPGSATLSHAIEHAFTNAAKLDATQAARKAPSLDADGGADALSDSPLAALDVDGSAVKSAQAKDASLVAEKATMMRGLLFFGLYLYECARVFADLPRQNPRPEALAIQPDSELWLPETGYPRIPAMALLNQYDCLGDLNQVATLDLTRYRLIAVHHPDLLRDATLAAVTGWLKDRPGLLYLHGDLATDNAAEDSVVGDLDGVLKNDWPWEADLALNPITSPVPVSALKGLGLDADISLTNAQAVCTYAPRNESARVLASGADGKPLLVLWRRPEFKGAVLFDGVANAPKAYLEALREVINGLQKDPGIGLALDGPILHEVLETTNLLAAACPLAGDGVKDVKAYPGLDLLTGQLNPVVGEGRSGVLIGRDFIGKYAASLSGLALLASQPLGKIECIAGGVRMRNEGLVRVAAESGRVTITPEGGGVLPVVKNPATWIILGTDEGVATLPVEGGTPLTYYRCGRPVNITAK